MTDKIRIALMKCIASLCLILLMIGCTLGNFWFTYGVFPKSWVSFVFFAVAGISLNILMQVVNSIKNE